MLQKRESIDIKNFTALPLFCNLQGDSVPRNGLTDFLQGLVGGVVLLAEVGQNDVLETIIDDLLQEFF